MDSIRIKMTRIIALLVLGFFSSGSTSVIVKSHGVDRNPSCFKGPEYWCLDIRSAKECGAVKHCSQSIWPHVQLPEDNEDICQICKEMVQEARDQVLSNETQDELRQVFEGTCLLIPVKAIKKECMKLADDFVPELVDMLASQMNPQMVCATAGLCNSERINKMWLDYKNAKMVGLVGAEESEIVETSRRNPIPGGCEDCRKFVVDTRTIIETHSKEEVLERLLYICDQAGSYSDLCKIGVAQNFPEIYEILTTSLDADKICEIVGMCDISLMAGVEIKIKGANQIRKIGDGTECEFCEAVVNHVRDMVNTSNTEEEFMQVAEGLCHATKYEDKCVAFIHRYYRVVYAFIVNEMQPKELCSAIGLCDKARILDRPTWIPILGDSEEMKTDIAAILSPLDVLPLVKIEVSKPLEQTPLIKLQAAQPVEKMPLMKMIPAEHIIPFDKKDVSEMLSLFPASLIGTDGKEGLRYLGDDEVKNKPFCSICELIMHDIDTILADPDTDKKIEDLVKTACDRLPSSLRGQCDSFISQYSDAILFVVAQQLDPAKACPALNLCVDVELSNDIEVFPEWKSEPKVNADPNCALCQFAVKELEHQIRENKTEDSIRKALENLCAHLPSTLRDECDDFVDTNAARLVDLVINEYSPEEVCIALKMCQPKALKDVTLGEFMKKIESQNQKPSPKTVGQFLAENADKTGEAKKLLMEVQSNVDSTSNPLCVMCEFAMAKIDRMLETNATEEDIRKTVRNVCYVLPKSVELQCFAFLDQYGQAVIDLLIKQLEPKAVCSLMGVCSQPQEDDVTVHMNRCEICEVAVEYFDTLLEDDTVEENIDQILEKVCAIIPQKNRDQCKAIIDTYGPYIVSLIGQLANAKEVCTAIDLCNASGQVHMFGGEQCKLGPAYWCSSEKHAAACKEVEYCRTVVWKKED